MSSTRADRFSRVGLERDPLLRVERRQVLEEHLLARPFRRLEVDRFDLDQREVALAVLGRPDLAGDGVAGVEVELADLRRRHVDVVRPRQVVVIGGAQESEAVRQHFEHALGEDQPALFRARLQDLEDELLLAHAGRAGDVEPLRDLGQGADAHVLQRRQLQFFRRRGGGSAVAFGGCGGGCRRRGGCRVRRLRLHPDVCSPVWSISFHSSSSPSPVTAETGSTEVSNTDSNARRARIVRRAPACRFSSPPRRACPAARDPLPRRRGRSPAPDAARPPAAARPAAARTPPPRSPRTRSGSPAAPRWPRVPLRCPRVAVTRGDPADTAARRRLA